MKNFIKENKFKKWLGIQSPSYNNEETNKDEWIWISGYKGTDFDMKCLDFQYEMHKQFNADGEIMECRNGFHLCIDLSCVFKYYAPCDGNRYFHVRALVRKKDFCRCGSNINYTFFTFTDKLVAKSIEFVSEVSREEFEYCLLKHHIFLRCLPKHILSQIPNISCDEAIQLYNLERLRDAGYTKEFSEYLVEHKNNKIEEAIKLGEVKDISMDAKVSILLCDLAQPKIKSLPMI